MKRDLDLIRALLLKVEADPPPRLGPTAISSFGIAGHTELEVRHHVDMLLEAEFLSGDSNNIATVDINGTPTLVARFKLTWRGYELLDDIRDPEIWRKTKERAKGVVGLGLGLVWELAKAEIRSKLGLP